MNVESEEIGPKVCPLCRAVISRCRRYTLVLHRARADLEQIKGKIHGSPIKIREIQKEIFSIIFLKGFPLDRFSEMKEYLAVYLLETDSTDSVFYLDYIKVSTQYPQLCSVVICLLILPSIG
jgi:hypothetical protein